MKQKQQNKSYRPYTDVLMAEHLRKLLQLGKLSFPYLDILHNLSLLPSSSVLKNAFKSWLKLPTLNDVNYLAKYGFINDDTQNIKISLHPLIKEVVALESHTLLNSLHYICLVHGLEVKKPQNVIGSLISITENILVDISEDYLLFLQDMFPYLEKYLVTDYLPKLVEQIEYVMKQDAYNSQIKDEVPQNTHFQCDKALLLDYKAELFLIKNDYKNALKKRLKAINILEPLHTLDANALHTALAVRQEYAYLGPAESHDMLQQLMNLTNMLLLSKNIDMAKQVLSAYKTLFWNMKGHSL